MWKISIAFLFAFAVSAFFSGCLGSFAANQGRRQAARSADYYARTYAVPEIEAANADDPQAREQAAQSSRQARNDMADVIVRSGNDRQKTRVGVDDQGWLTNER